MKTRTSILFLSFLFFASVLISCEDDEKHEIKFEKDTVTLDFKGSEEIISLTCDGQWHVRDVPDWLVVSPTSGEASAEIRIKAKENKEEELRSSSLVFNSIDAKNTLTVKQLSIMDMEPFIEIEDDDIILSAGGSYETIKLTTNRKWEIKNIPSWLTVSPSSGNKSAEIRFQVNEYREPEGRTTGIQIVADSAEKQLQVTQRGLKDNARLHVLSTFPFNEYSFSIPYKRYEAKSYNPFVNPSITDKIYLGNLVVHNTGSNTDIPEITGYTFNPIDVSTSAAIAKPVTNYIPSKDGQNEFIKYIIAQKPKNQVSFSADKSGEEFYTHRQLRAIGLTNLGINLDEIISGHSYTEQEMTFKYGIIFSYMQVLFDVTMDYPDKLIKEEMSESDQAKEISYVGSINYGRVGLLIVESDTDSRDIKVAVNKVLENEPLTAQETDQLRYSSITHVYFNNDNEVQTKRGGLEAVNSYKDAILNIYEYIYPVGFRMQNYKDYTSTKFTFSFELP